MKKGTSRCSLEYPWAHDIQVYASHLVSLCSGGYNEKILDWMDGNLAYPTSDRAPKFIRTMNPCWNPIYEAFASGIYRVISVNACTGGGKSTFIESLTAFCIACMPGSMLIVAQTDPDAQIFAESRLMPLLSEVPPVAVLIPKSRMYAKKNSIQFAHMRLDLGGANLTTLQSTSRRYVMGDEVWLWDQGLVREALARLHDRENGCAIFVGQGGVAGDEHDGINDTCEHHYCGWVCPHCGAWHRYSTLPNQFVFEDIRNTANQRIIREIVKTVKLRCEACEATFPDVYGIRQQLAMSAEYRPVGDQAGAFPNRIHYTFHALAVPWIPWSSLALELLQVSDSKKIGDYGPFQTYKQKRAAEFWNSDADIETPRLTLATGNYTEASFNAGQLIDNEGGRFLTVDVQRHDFFAVVQGWTNTGASKVLTAQKLETWGQIIELQNQYKIKPPGVALDSNFNSAETSAFAAKHNFTTLRGSRINSWQHIDRRNRKYQKPFAPFQRVLINNQVCLLSYFSALHFKDILAVLRQGRAVPWELPRDISDEFIRHQAAEVRREVANKDGSPPSPRWVLVRDKEPNHFLDCCVMQIVMATMLGFVRIDEGFNLQVAPADLPDPEQAPD